jgi:hypothetical protein
MVLAVGRVASPVVSLTSRFHFQINTVKIFQVNPANLIHRGSEILPRT